MYRWKKLGRVFGPEHGAGRSWFQTFAQAPASVALPGSLRMYFSCRPAPDEAGQYVSYSAFVDLDSTDPRKILDVAAAPILQLGGRGRFDEFGIYPFSAIKIGDRIRGYYGGWTRCESVPFNVAIGVADSMDDGMTFTRLGEGPVLGYTPEEPFVLSGPKIRRFGDEYFLFYIAGRLWKAHEGRREPVYRIRMARSRDGLVWQRENRDLIPVSVEADEAQASPDVFFRDGTYHMYFCYRYSTDFRGSSRGYRIGYASSVDLVHWERDDSKCSLQPSGEGWDSQMMSYPHVFETGGQVYMAYLGNDVGRQGFGLAILDQ